MVLYPQPLPHPDPQPSSSYSPSDSLLHSCSPLHHLTLPSYPHSHLHPHRPSCHQILVTSIYGALPLYSCQAGNHAHCTHTAQPPASLLHLFPWGASITTQFGLVIDTPIFRGCIVSPGAFRDCLVILSVTQLSSGTALLAQNATQLSS